MPQKLPENDQGASFDYRQLKQRPEASAAMAAALVSWSHFEWNLSHTYALTLGFTLEHYRGWAPPTHPLARQIFDTLSGLGARLDLLEKALSWYVPPVVAAFVAIRPKIRRLAGKRANVAHGVWGIKDRYPKDLILNPEFGEVTRWSAKDFDNLADEFHALNVEFGQTVVMPIWKAGEARPGKDLPGVPPLPWQPSS